MVTVEEAKKMTVPKLKAELAARGLKVCPSPTPTPTPYQEGLMNAVAQHSTFA